MTCNSNGFSGRVKQKGSSEITLDTDSGVEDDDFSFVTSPARTNTTSILEPVASGDGVVCGAVKPSGTTTGMAKYREKLPMPPEKQ
ncbi:hypothetical protein quinque_000908 [Culex quinquefasciatus]